MRDPFSDLIKGFNPDTAIRPELNKPAEVAKPKPVRVVKVSRTRNKGGPKPPKSPKPRDGVRTRVLLKLLEGPATISTLMKVCSSKGSYRSRTSEMRLEGLIEDTVSLTETGRKEALHLKALSEPWDDFIANGGVYR